MGQVVADLVANIRVSGVSESQAQIEGFGASLGTIAGSGDDASAGIDAVSSSADAAAGSLGAASGSADSAAASLDAVAGSGDAAAASLDRVGASGEAAGAGLGAVGAGADASAASMGATGGAANSANLGILGLAAGGLLLTKNMFGASEQFQTWMQDLASISPALQNSTDLQNQMAQSILNISTSSGFAASDVQRAMYYAVSGTKDLADAQALAAKGSELGVIGMTNSTDATVLLTGTMNAFGYAIKDLPKLNDEFTASISNGVLRLTDLQSVLPQVNLQAAEMGIQLPTILAGLDVMTNKGLTGFQAATEMKNLIIGFDKPSVGGTAEFSKLGFSSGVDMVQQLGLQGAIQAIFADIGNDPAAIAKVFPDIRKMQGFLALGSSGADWAKTQGDISGSDGEADKALAAQEQATSFHIGVMKAKFAELMVLMGNGVRPIVQDVADGFGFLFGALSKITGPILGVLGAATALVSAFAFLSVGGALLSNLLGDSLGVVLEGIVGSALAAAAPFVALAGAIYLLYEAFQQDLFGIKDQVINAFNAIASAVDLGLQWFGYYRYQGLDPVTAALDATGKALDKLGLGWVANLVTALVDPIANLKTLATDIKAAYNHTKTWSDLLDKLPPGMKKLGLGLLELASGFGDLFRGDWQDALTRFGHGFEFLGQAIGASLLQLAKWAVVTIPSVIVNIADWAWGEVKDLGTWLKDHVFGQSQGDGTGSNTGPGFGNVAGTGFTIPQLLVNIASWGAGVIADLGTFLYEHIHSTGVWLISTTINIASWTAGTIADLGTFLWGYIHDVGVWLVSVVVNVANWAAGTIVDLAGWLLTYVGGISVPLTSVIVNVANWAAGTIADLGTFLYGILKDTEVFLVTVKISVSSWVIDFTNSTFAADVGSAVVSAIQDLTLLGADAAGAIWSAIGGFSGWTNLITTNPYNLGADLGSAIHGAIVTAVEGLKDADWTTILKDIAGFMVAAVAATPLLMQSLATAFISGFTGFLISVIAGPDAAASFKSFVAGALSGIASAVSDPSLFSDAAAALASGLWNAVVQWYHDNVSVGALVNAVIGGGSAGPVIPIGNNPGTTTNPTTGTVIPYDPNDAPYMPGSPSSATSDFSGGTVTLALQFSLGGHVYSDIQSAISGSASGPGGPHGGSSSFSLPAPDTSKFTAALGTAETFAKTTLGSIFTYAGQWSQSLGTIATSAGNLFNKNLAAGMQIGLTSAELFLTTIVTAATAWSAKIGAAATATGTAFNANLSAGMQKGLTSAELFMTTIVTAAQQFSLNLTAAALSAGNAFNTNLGNGLTKALTATQTAVGSIVTAVTSGFSGLGTDAYNVGYAIGQGINDGIAFWTSAIAATASGAVTAAITAAKTAGGVASPSREFMIIGSALGEGLHVGLDSWSGALANKSAAIVSGMIGSASQGTATAGGGSGYHFHGPVAVNVKLDGTQPDIGKKVVDAIATAFGTARQMQVGM